MDEKIKRVILALVILGFAALFVTGIDIFMSGHSKELEKAQEKEDFYETDDALRTKDDCDKKRDAEACLKTGLYYLDGKIVEANTKKAAKYLLKACDLRSAVGCYQLGKFWQGDMNSKLKRKARMYFQRACDLGDLESCGIIKGK
jgi:TPR repeat protein